jgi:hypothetical protein
MFFVQSRMSAFMDGRGPHGNGANHLESMRTGPIESVARGTAEASDAGRGSRAAESNRPSSAADAAPHSRIPGGPGSWARGTTITFVRILPPFTTIRFFETVSRNSGSRCPPIYTERSIPRPLRFCDARSASSSHAPLSLDCCRTAGRNCEVRASVGSNGPIKEVEDVKEVTQAGALRKFLTAKPSRGWCGAAAGPTLLSVDTPGAPRDLGLRFRELGRPPAL